MSLEPPKPENPYRSPDLDEEVPRTRRTGISTSPARPWALLVVGATAIRAVPLVPWTWSFANPNAYQTALAEMTLCVIAAVIACVAWLLLSPASERPGDRSRGHVALGLAGFLFVVSLLII